MKKIFLIFFLLFGIVEFSLASIDSLVTKLHEKCKDIYHLKAYCDDNDLWKDYCEFWATSNAINYTEKALKDIYHINSLPADIKNFLEYETHSCCNFSEKD